jgi:hypothetical protein
MSVAPEYSVTIGVEARQLNSAENEDHWLIKGDNLRVTSDDAQGSGKLRRRIR